MAETAGETTSETTGASYGEQLLDSSRRNNEDLLKSILEEVGLPEKIAELVNLTRDPLGNTAVHLATKGGNYEVLDILLDHENVNVNSQNSVDGDTPLHLAVKYAEDDADYGKFLVEELLDAGADPKVRNKNGDKPSQVIFGDKLQELKGILEDAEYTAVLTVAAPKQEPEEPEGDASASDSE